MLDMYMDVKDVNSAKSQERHVLITRPSGQLNVSIAYIFTQLFKLFLISKRNTRVIRRTSQNNNNEKSIATVTVTVRARREEKDTCVVPERRITITE